MEQITITTKIQIIVSDSDKFLLDETMNAYRHACNYVSEYVFSTHDIKQFSVNKALYYTLREKFGLKSQMTQSVIKTVISKYKSIIENCGKWIRPSFKKPQYDLVWNRDYSISEKHVSVNTINGRIKLLYLHYDLSKYFNNEIYKFGTAKLINKHGKYYLYVPITYDIEENNISDICNIVGVDRGINFVITTYDSNYKSIFVSGRFIKQKRLSYSKLRKELQMRHTPSARRRLKAIGSRENRWMQDVNHCVSKALVENNPKHTLFVLEDLTGIKNKMEKVNNKDRYVFVSWSFYDLEKKIIYKAKKHQCSVIKVNPHYTSQRCPICGHTEKKNRNKKEHLFTCKKCGYKSNDDRIGAMNLYYMGINYIYNCKVPNTVVEK